MPLSPGQRLGPYELGTLIGAGGMGEVYQATDTRLGRTVAIKVLPAAVASDPERRARFEREARTVGALSHPNVVAIHDVGAVDDVSFLVMELLEGETLRSRLSGVAEATSMHGQTSATSHTTTTTGHGLPRKKAFEIAAQVATGLAAAHARGIVHRDLKPENIFLTSDGRVKILDFGLARALSSGVPDAQTRTTPVFANAGATAAGVVMGTVGYMAPEQVKGKDADHRADIFALGVVLFEMLTGTRAFAKDSPIETMSAILAQDPLERRESSVAIPAIAEGVLRHCLEKQPEERFESARDLAFQLTALASGSTTSGATQITAVMSDAPAKRSRTWVLAAAGVALFVGGLALGLALRRGPATASTQALAFSVDPPPEASLGLIGGTMQQASRPPIAVSPDGTKIVFRANAHNTGAGKLYLRTLVRADAQPIEGTEDATYPFFSADGSKLAFCQGGRLKQTAFDGGPVQNVGACANPRTPGSWNRDGKILFVPSYLGALMQIVDGGAATEVLASEYSENGCQYVTPSWLPDGKHYVLVHYGVRSTAVPCEGLYLGEVGTPVQTRIIEGRVDAVATVGTALLYLRDGSLYQQSLDSGTWRPAGTPALVATGAVSIAGGTGAIAYAGRPNAKPHRFALGNRIAWFERGAANNPVGFIGEAGAFGDPRISPDQRSLLVTSLSAAGRSEGAIYDIATGVPNPIGDRGTIGIFSSDSKSIAYLGTFEGMKIWDMGTNQDRALRGPNDTRLNAPTDWYQNWVTAGMGGGLHAIDVTGKSAPIPIATAATGGSGSDADVSPDGKWVAFTSGSRVFVAPFPGPGQRRPVAAQLADTVRWRDDGREVYFVAGDNIEDQQLMAVPVSYSGSDISFGPATALFKMPALSRNWAFDVTKDGKRFVAVIAAERDPVSITVLLNPVLVK